MASLATSVEGLAASSAPLRTDEDEQEQTDEIEVLASIYPDSLNVDANSILPTFSINIPLDDVAEMYTCSFFNHGDREPIAQCNLTYLTPILLRVSFPTNYPSLSPPLFSIQIDWLSYFQLKKLCGELDDIWSRNGPGVAIVYEWIDFLKNGTLSFLKVGKALNIGSHVEDKVSVEDLREKRLARFSRSCRDSGIDNRAISGWRPAFQLESGERSDIEQLMGNLIRYDMIMKRKAFLARTHTCLVCWNEEEGKSFTTLSCDHSFCTLCMKEHVGLNVKEGSVDKIVCPDSRCKRAIEPSLIKELLTEEQYDRWERVLLQKTLDCMKDVVYCPRKKCNTPVIEESDNLGQCVQCMFAFCTLCFQSWHPGSQCMSAEDKLRALKMRGSRGNMEEFLRKQMEFVNEQKASLAMKRMGCKQCPGCGCAISKTAGCNKMRCRCGMAFCFLCGEADIDYNHFNQSDSTPGQKRKCVLFSMDEIRRWENQMLDMRVDRYQEQVWRLEGQGVDVNAQQTVPCCYCGQQVFKEGKNNHLTCWSCTRHFCFQCRRPVTKAKDHYSGGKGKCKQHS